ncbi:MAG TPA: hypothetical protein PLZ51_00575 [Aggregatilineales bacterium]|nr:hypothetical protein [Aggregatilineales bacterium]
MAEYEALDKNVEVLGITISSVIVSFGDDAVKILKKYDLYPILPDGWYNQQRWLDSFKELAATHFLSLVSVGMKIPDLAAWPPDINSVHAALASINVAYSMNHRNGEIGGYYYTETGPTSGTMVCKNPYPSDFDYGLIYRTVQKFRDSTSTKLVVKRDEDNPNRMSGGDSCTYYIEW